MEEKKKHRITLIDILVIVAVIALVLAIVIPATDRGHPGGRIVICKSNLKQLSLGFLICQNDKDVRADLKNWCDLLKSYVGEDAENIYICPIDKTGPCSYAMNKNIAADANELPGDLVLLFESAPGWNQVGGSDDVITDRHGKPGANIAFADGHVEFVEAEDIPNLRWTIEQKRGAGATR